MLSETQTKSANYLRIIAVLRSLKESGTITEKEYGRAKKYYKKLTGADICITNQTYMLKSRSNKKIPLRLKLCKMSRKKEVSHTIYHKPLTPPKTSIHAGFELFVKSGIW